MDPSAQAVAAAIATRDFAKLGAMLDPDVKFRFATPNKVAELTGPKAVADQLAVWFAQGEVVPLGHGAAPGPAGTVRVWYSFRVRPQPVTKAPGWHVIEQQLYLRDGPAPIRNLRMACSGFIPEAAAEGTKP